MNERIKQILNDSGLDVQHDGIVLTKNISGGIALEKFAELLISEVLEMVVDTKNYNRHIYTNFDHARAVTFANELAESIQKHFGTNKQFKVKDYGTMGRKISSFDN